MPVSPLPRLLQLQEQMRALYKAISAPRVRRASSKGGGYTCQSGSGWDEFTKRLTGECLAWMRQHRVSRAILLFLSGARDKTYCFPCEGTYDPTGSFLIPGVTEV